VISHYQGAEFVCGDCFSDDGLKALISNRVASKRCDFCGKKSRQLIAARLDDVIDHIDRSIRPHYDDPSNAGLVYESREGGWQGTTYTTDEVFEAVDLDFPNDVNDKLREAISDGLENDLWSDAEPYRLSPDEQLRFSWEHFCAVTKHKLRYFFAQHESDDDDEIYSPIRVLELIFSFAERVGAFSVMPRGTHLYRARHQPAGSTYASGAQLGPPPVEKVIQTNRMSPPGIVMTYLADDPLTALAETANQPGTFAVGEFVTERESLILDLTKLPAIPSIFADISNTQSNTRLPLTFLYGIGREISRPIARDDRVHIEYVPTQVVTEYVRTAVTVDGRTVDGIRYRSSRRAVQTAIVLFADDNNIVLEKEEQSAFYHSAKDRWLRLQRAEVYQVTASDIALWTPLGARR
jgi:hypothetical protein